MISYGDAGDPVGSAGLTAISSLRKKPFPFRRRTDSTPMNAVSPTAWHLTRLLGTNLFLEVSRPKSVSQSIFGFRPTVGSGLGQCLLVPPVSRTELWKRVDMSMDLSITTKNAWINSELSFNWLEHFHTYIAYTRHRKTILLIDTCSVHGNASTNLELSNFILNFYHQAQPQRFNQCMQV